MHSYAFSHPIFAALLGPVQVLHQSTGFPLFFPSCKQALAGFLGVWALTQLVPATLFKVPSGLSYQPVGFLTFLP